MNKEKQQGGIVQNKEVFWYKPYNITLEQEWPKTSKPVFIQEEVDNLKKALQTLQLPVKTIPFYPPPHFFKNLENKMNNTEKKLLWSSSNRNIMQILADKNFLSKSL